MQLCSEMEFYCPYIFFKYNRFFLLHFNVKVVNCSNRNLNLGPLLTYLNNRSLVSTSCW